MNMPSVAPIRKILTPRQLLTIAAVVECLAGLAFVLAPDATIALLLGPEPDSAGRLIGRVAGVALLALGISCWGARVDPGGPARWGTLWAITLYNAGAGFLLVAFAATGQARGVAALSAGVLHLGLAAAFATRLRPKNDDG
jgi:hypothetical protein